MKLEKKSAGRVAYDRILRFLLYFCALLTCALLVLLIGYIFLRGLPNVTWQLLSTQESFRNDTIGRKVMGEGCSYASLCHLCTECPPLHYNINIYAVVPDRVAPGERPFPAPPRAQPETQKRCRVQRTQHRLISQSITHQPYFPCFRP